MLLLLVTSAFFNNFPISGENVIAWNYRLDRVRLPAITYLEDHIRLCVSLSDVIEKDSGLLTTNRVGAEIYGMERPAMVADFLVMLTDLGKHFL